MEQKQCPNCGGYKVKERMGCRGLGYLIALFWMGIGAIGVLGAGVGFLANISYYDVVGAFQVSGMLLCAGAPFLASGLLVLRSLSPKAGQEERYVCSLCGYEWKHTVGEPEPSVHVRPNLIDLGEHELEEERRRARWD